LRLWPDSQKKSASEKKWLPPHQLVDDDKKYFERTSLSIYLIAQVAKNVSGEIAWKLFYVSIIVKG
jgi:hypothetical protein